MVQPELPFDRPLCHRERCRGRGRVRVLLGGLGLLLCKRHAREWLHA